MINFLWMFCLFVFCWICFLIFFICLYFSIFVCFFLFFRLSLYCCMFISFHLCLFFFTKFFWMIIYDYSGNVWFCEWVLVGNGSAFSNTQSHDIFAFFSRKKSIVRGLLCFWRLWEYPCASRNFGIVFLCYA